MIADSAFDAVLSDYNKRLADEEKIMMAPDFSPADADPESFLIPVGEDVGLFMQSLVLGLKAQTIVELGTSYGYSTLFLAAAARVTGGKVYSYDIAQEKQTYAKQQLERAQLADFVIFRQGDAVELIETQPGPVDFALIDLVKDLYIPCLERLAPLLGPSGTIVADNMTFPPQNESEAGRYRAAVRAIPGMQAVLMPLGNGIDLAVKQGFLN